MGRATMTAVFGIFLVLFAGCVNGFYLPGAARDYHDGESVAVDVNVLQSVNTHLPYEYYSLPFCKPNYPVKKTDGAENLGVILMGDRIRKSPYDKLKMKVDISCEAVCEPIVLDQHRKQDFEERIKDEYTISLIIDGLPVSLHNPDTNSYSLGLPIGAREGDKIILYNHLEFMIKYTLFNTATSPDAKRIVAFHARPFSHKFEVTDGKFAPRACDEKFDPTAGEPLTTADDYLTFTYGVKWEETTDPWATRWDIYLVGGDSEIHWFSIVNSLMIVLFLSGMVGVILARTLKKDIYKYNQSMDEEDWQEETGWKMVHADVFRPPTNARMLAVLVGSGVQMLGVAVTVLVFAAMGLLSPANRGSFVTALVLCFVLLGTYGGYYTARLVKTWYNHTDWVAIALTATFVPGVVFSGFFVINLFVWFTRSSAALPFTTILFLLGLWLGVCMPLTIIGGALGYKRDSIALPCRVTQLHRNIPPQPIYLTPASTILMGGILPFGAVFIEVFFILTSIWMNRYYYVFGFLIVVFFILVITCAEITIVMVYFQLCSENWQWWWRSFFTSGSSGVYMFAYAVFYFFTSALKIRKFVSVLLFFGYMGLISFVFSVMTGTVGFLAAFTFVRHIYGSIKVD